MSALARSAPSADPTRDEVAKNPKPPHRCDPAEWEYAQGYALYTGCPTCDIDIAAQRQRRRFGSRLWWRTR